jgi:hypothetical protein
MHFGAIFAAQRGPHRKNPLLPANDRTIRAAFGRVNDAPTLRCILHRSGQTMASKLRFLHQFKTKPKPSSVLLTRGESPLSGAAAL